MQKKKKKKKKIADIKKTDIRIGAQKREISAEMPGTFLMLLIKIPPHHLDAFLSLKRAPFQGKTSNVSKYGMSGVETSFLVLFAAASPRRIRSLTV